ncbi:MAG: septal ring lytic transglycosylase RlpA family protein [Leptospiraceae bacterium]|nr:septal ring lytic transglycosylase RlpA family protein [Leptospiraceae bacterium]
MKTGLITALLAMFLAVSCTGQQVRTNDPVVASTPAEDDFFGDGVAASDADSSPPVVENKNSGYASWYGKELHGKPTASGEIFDMNKYTAAHKTFPMGSVVLVINQENGKKQIVKINDRGPYVEGRIIDVSFAAARDLGFAETGVAKVSLELVQAGSNDFLSKANVTPVTPEFPAEEEIIDPSYDDESEDFAETGESSSSFTFLGKKPQGYTIQIGAFKTRHNAERHLQDMKSKIGSKHPFFIAKKGEWHYIMVGDFKSSKSARAYHEKLKSDGIDVMYRGKISYLNGLQSFRG